MPKRKQRPINLAPKEEGLFRWLPYIGWMLMIILPIVYNVATEMPYIFVTDDCNSLHYPFLHHDILFKLFLVSLGVGLISTIITFLKSHYQISLKRKAIGLGIFIGCTLIFELLLPFIAQYSSIPIVCHTIIFEFLPNFSAEYCWGSDNMYFALNVLWFLSWLYLFLLFWYMQYFYKKSQNGCPYVWSKVILFSIVPFLLFIHPETITSPYCYG